MFRNSVIMNHLKTLNNKNPGEEKNKNLEEEKNKNLEEEKEKKGEKGEKGEIWFLCPGYPFEQKYDIVTQNINGEFK